MTRRRLSPEEVDLWRQVARTTQRLHPERSAAEHQAPNPRPKPHKTPKARIESFELGKRADDEKAGHDILPGLDDRIAAAPVRMDRKAFDRLKRGKLKPEARLDLHGMTLDHAHPELIRFILTSQAKGRRLVLVITGKGKPRDDDGPIPLRAGVLRNSVPQWLSAPPLAQAVLQLSQAHSRHGGSGAYYVYLRRQR